ncbi:hypothetical protein BH23THE1_BH23THE1_33260 [soil metagenome]
MDIYNTLTDISAKVGQGCDEVSSVTMTGEGVDWLSNMLGFNDGMDENGVFKDKDEFERTKILNKMLSESALYNEDTGKLLALAFDCEYNAGWFISPTVAQLVDMVLRKVPQRQTAERNKVEIISESLDKPAENFSTIYSNSGLNALPSLSYDHNYPFSGIRFNDGNLRSNVYNRKESSDAVMASAGTFVRNYWLNRAMSGQFNAMSNLGVSHMNGRLCYNESLESHLHNQDFDQFRVACMLYTQVVGPDLNKNLIITNKRVNQIFMHDPGSVSADIFLRLMTSQLKGFIGMSLILHHLNKTAGRCTNSEHSVVVIPYFESEIGPLFNLWKRSLQDAMNNYQSTNFTVRIIANDKTFQYLINSYNLRNIKPVSLPLEVVSIKDTHITTKDADILLTFNVYLGNMASYYQINVDSVAIIAQIAELFENITNRNNAKILYAGDYLNTNTRVADLPNKIKQETLTVIFR